MEFIKKCARILRPIFGWLLIVMGGISGVSAAVCVFVILFGGMEIDSIAERLAVFSILLVMTVGFFAILWLGIRVKNGGKKKNMVLPEILSTNKQENKLEERLDDITFISHMRRIALPDSSWQKYDVILNARGCGWDMIKDWADYLSEADLENISQVTTGIMMDVSSPVTQSYIEHGRKCTQTPELDTEQGILSIAGMSKVLHAPVKIVWINQTNQLSLFTSVDDELTMRKYAETVARRTFGTKDAMKLGVPVPICGDIESKQ